MRSSVSPVSGYLYSYHGGGCPSLRRQSQSAMFAQPSEEPVTMRLLIAMMKHETNTFSPVPTPLARFRHRPGPLYGAAAGEPYRGTGSRPGSYLALRHRE